MRCFIDSNVIIYTIDPDEPTKRPQAQRRLARIIRDGRAVISSQIWQETTAICIQKLKMPRQRIQQVHRAMRSFETVPVTPDIVADAVDLRFEHTLSWWDALVVAAAAAASCTILLSEDLNHGQQIRGVRIENPFIASTGSP